MQERGRAFFVHRPRKIDELKVPHPIEKETDYLVVKRLILTPAEYKNFVTDMLVEREFLEKNAALLKERQDIVECLLVQIKGELDGILVVPNAGGFVKLAAYFEG